MRNLLLSLLKLSPVKLFGKLNLTQKMLIGYTILTVSSVFIFVYAKSSFQKLNTLNRSILNVDITIQKATRDMMNAIMDQDNYEKRYLILKSNDMLVLFSKRGKDFNAWIEKLVEIQSQKGQSLEELGEFQELNNINKLHMEYETTFAREVDLIKKHAPKRAYVISNHEMKQIFDKITRALNRMSAIAKNAEELKMEMIGTIGQRVFLGTTILWVISVILGVLVGLLVTYHITSSIHKLKIVAEHIAEGDFDYDPQIKTADEIGSLAAAFADMGRRLKKLEMMYLDASPLTHLAGGIAVENIVKKRIESGNPMAFCLLDIDNFKSFNDRYGYALGNQVIKETAKIIESTVKTFGSPDDFVGHIGGDDFVVITTPDRIHKINAEIILQFDMNIPQFYDQLDRKNGYILGKNRQAVEIKFPIMSISIAVVTNEQRKFTDPMEVSEVAAELKDYAKTFQKSIYVINKRITG